MKKLIEASEAKKIVSGSDERKDELITLMNATIQSQAERGLRWAHLPSSASQFEKDWLIDELTLRGYKISNTDPVVGW